MWKGLPFHECVLCGELSTNARGNRMDNPVKLATLG
jgi:hypothetical protein